MVRGGAAEGGFGRYKGEGLKEGFINVSNMGVKLKEFINVSNMEMKLKEEFINVSNTKQAVQRSRKRLSM